MAGMRISWRAALRPAAVLAAIALLISIAPLLLRAPEPPEPDPAIGLRAPELYRESSGRRPENGRGAAGGRSPHRLQRRDGRKRPHAGPPADRSHERPHRDRKAGAKDRSDKHAGGGDPPASEPQPASVAAPQPPPPQPAPPPTAPAPPPPPAPVAPAPAPSPAPQPSEPAIDHEFGP